MILERQVGMGINPGDLGQRIARYPPYHAIEMYRFRFARVCVPPCDSAFLLASPSGVATVACGDELLG